MSERSNPPALSAIESRARTAYALERLLDPSLPAWDDATYMTRSRWLRAALSSAGQHAA